MAYKAFRKKLKLHFGEPTKNLSLFTKIYRKEGCEIQLLVLDVHVMKSLSNMPFATVKEILRMLNISWPTSISCASSKQWIDWLFMNSSSDLCRTITCAIWVFGVTGTNKCMKGKSVII
ncbi:hypothetical protein V6Z12_A06G086400 [Gossypium hirsutum]